MVDFFHKKIIAFSTSWLCLIFHSLLTFTGAVYEIPCQDCEKVYIGETGRSLQKRMTEHKAAVRRGDRNNGIIVHAWDEDHRTDWEGANIKEVEQQLWKRKALEAVHIHMQPNTNNPDCGLILTK